MAKLGPFTNASVKINAVDLSNRVESVTLDLGKDDIDLTAMGDGGHTHVGGLENSKFNVNFWQDFAASEVDATLLPIFQAGTAVACKLIASGTTPGASMPMYTFNMVITDYQPIAGKVGDGLQAPVTGVVSGTITSATTGSF